MNPFYVWLGLWLYVFNRQRFDEIFNQSQKPKAQILEFKRRA